MRQQLSTVVDYVKRYGDNNFWRQPFNDVDSLILAMICYASLELTPFAKIRNFNCTIEELGELADAKKLTWPLWSRERGEALISAAADSRRYGDVLMHHYRRQIDGDVETQFVAITFTINTDMGYVDVVTFQGTDDTMVGWKEDFNMMFERHLPAQVSAARYLNEIASLSDNKLIVTGHSKGGNLAVYSSMKCSRHVRKRIMTVYDHDGPGFLPRTFTALERIGVAGKIHKIVPESAFFGLLLESKPSNIKVVKSDARSILQHDGMSWLVDGDQFATADDVTGVSHYVARSIRRWLGEISPEQRQKFVDITFDILSKSRQSTLPGFKHYLAKNLSNILKDFRESDPAVKQVVTDTLKLLARSSWLEVKDTVRRRFDKQK